MHADILTLLTFQVLDDLDLWWRREKTYQVLRLYGFLIYISIFMLLCDAEKLHYYPMLFFLYLGYLH
jgi:hypothetical protein